MIVTVRSGPIFSPRVTIEISVTYLADNFGYLSFRQLHPGENLGHHNISIKLMRSMIENIFGIILKLSYYGMNNHIIIYSNYNFMYQYTHAKLKPSQDAKRYKSTDFIYTGTKISIQIQNLA